MRAFTNVRIILVLKLYNGDEQETTFYFAFIIRYDLIIKFNGKKMTI